MTNLYRLAPRTLTPAKVIASAKAAPAGPAPACYHSAVLHRPTLVCLLPLVLASSLGLLGCYPEPIPSSPSEVAETSKLESSGPAGAPSSDSTSRPGAPALDQTAQTQRVAQIGKLLERLGPSAGVPRGKRAGAEDWRAVELEKLGEVVLDCCTQSDVACRGCLAPLTEGSCAPDELWPIYGRFLGPLAGRAAAGVDVLGSALLQDKDGVVRDRAFRVAVGSKVMTRGLPSEDGYRIATLPRTPRAGQPALIVLERAALCTEARMEVKGPDSSGRIDLQPVSDCPDSPEAEGEFVPKALRYVLSHRLASFPASGLLVHVAKSEEPILHVPAQLAPSPETAAGSGSSRP